MLHPEPMSKGWLKKRLYLLLFGFMLRSARRILVVNQEEADFVHRRLGAPAEVMPNGVAVGGDPVGGSEPPIEVEGAVLFIGRLQALKGIEGLVRGYAMAVRKGLRCPLALIGPDEGARQDIQRVARESGVSDQVHLLGPIYGEAKRRALRRCRMLAHRPRYEGFGMTIVEAMAEARPVVTTERAGVARQCPTDVLKIAPDTDEGFASAILDVWHDPAGAQAMGDRARVWVESRLSWPAIAMLTRTAYMP
jgi:glycosyltransferase involved in cell wall biosynthesis